MSSRMPVPLPQNAEPFWFREGNPLANHQSQRRLPASADVVVIGAGLTGAATAYHLAADARGGTRVVVLDQGDPAGEASGRNGGNFELIPENSVGVYEGVAKERYDFLHRCYRELPREILQAESERQASLVLGLSLRNRDLLKEIVLREPIDCDFSPRGWLHLACSDSEEQGMCDEVMLAARHGQRVELWSRSRIRAEFGIESRYLGRFVPGDGTYHPFKYVCGLLRCALGAGVELYTRTAVRQVESLSARRHHVHTARGTIQTRHVVVATNAFTSRLFPELNAIRAYQSQVMVTEDAPDRTRGRVVTCDHGPTFFNQPRAGAGYGRAPLLMGGGADRPMQNPSSRRRSPSVHRKLIALRDLYYPELVGRQVSAEWIGPMGFTPDQLPVIGFLRPGVVVAAGYNGYGGSYTTAAGQAAAEMVRTGAAPDWVPADVFSPRRMIADKPVFMTERAGLWRIAQSLSQQLRAVDRQIAEAIALRPRNGSRASSNGAFHVTGTRAISHNRARKKLEPELLRALPAFEAFTPREVGIVARAMGRLDLPRGSVLYREGSKGGTCFVVLHGAVGVTTTVHDVQQLLSELPAGSVVGQVSVIDGRPRSGTCIVQRDAVLAELNHDACVKLLHGRSPIGLKLLGLLNDGLIDALRAADRQLLRLRE